MKAAVAAKWFVSVGLSVVAVLGAPQVHATTVGIGADASNYVVLYEGTGGHNLSITNVTINGNIGVGGTGVVQDSGPSTITGSLDFSAANTGQFHNNNASNVGPTSVNFNVAAVTNALNAVNALSAGLSGGTNIALSNGAQLINESAGVLTTFNGVTYSTFNVTSYSQTDGNVLTINGDGSGNPVVLNFGFSSNVNLKGLVTLNGLTPDQVLFNFNAPGTQNINLNTNASSFSAAFQGIILAPNDVLSMTNANLNGRFFGGDSGDMQIVSGTTINSPRVPEPATLMLVGAGILSLSFLRRRRTR